jgi:hypothetical protein
MSIFVVLGAGEPNPFQTIQIFPALIRQKKQNGSFSESNLLQ